MIEIRKLFELHNDEYGKFERVENKLSSRDDLHAFMLLDKLFPDIPHTNSYGTVFYPEIIAGVTHDQIWLSLKSEQIETLTSDQVLELVRCGVMYDEEEDCLSMFC